MRHIIYHCFGGTHSSVVAAAIHLGRLDRLRPPSAGELMALPLFDRGDATLWGCLRLLGQDRCGRRVYVLGRGPQGAATARALLAGFQLAGGLEGDQALLLVDTLACANTLMRVGGFLSRRLGLVRLGRPLVIWGTRRAYPRLVALVEQVERGWLGESP